MLKYSHPSPLRGTPLVKGRIFAPQSQQQKVFVWHYLHLEFPWNKVGVSASYSYKFSPWTRGVPRRGEGCEYFYIIPLGQGGSQRDNSESCDECPAGGCEYFNTFP